MGTGNLTLGPFNSGLALLRLSAYTRWTVLNRVRGGAVILF